MSIVEMAILSTDLASYFEKRERFLKSANAGEFEWQVQGAQKNYIPFSRTLCFLQLSLASTRLQCLYEMSSTYICRRGMVGSGLGSTQFFWNTLNVQIHISSP